MYILCKYLILGKAFLLFSLYTQHHSHQPPHVLLFFFFFVSSFFEICFGVWERRRSGAAKLTFTGVWPPVILSTPSLCGAQPSETSDRRAKGEWSTQASPAALSLPSAEVWCTDTHSPKKESSFFFFLNPERHLCSLLDRKQRRSVLVCECVCVWVCVYVCVGRVVVGEAANKDWSERCNQQDAALHDWVSHLLPNSEP